jgi:RNA polymerase sigma-70 factor (ECF subfamily)
MSPRSSAPIVTRRPSVAPPSPLDDLSWDSDRVLVVRAASGDDRAFALIVTRYSGLLRQVAYRALGSTDDIDDVVQETFLAAWTHADSVIDGESIAGWLVTTARRRSYDRLRTTAVRTRDGDPFEHRMLAADQPDPDDSARRSSLAADARRCSTPCRTRNGAAGTSASSTTSATTRSPAASPFPSRRFAA